MKALLNLANNIIKTDVGKVFLLTFNDKELLDLVITLNTEGQLRIGLQATGVNLPRYSLATQFISGGKKKQGDLFTLFDTGEFYRSFDIFHNSNAITIEADTDKPDKDLLDYGDLLGLTDKSIGILNLEVIPIMRDVLLNDWLKR